MEMLAYTVGELIQECSWLCLYPWNCSVGCQVTTWKHLRLQMKRDEAAAFVKTIKGPQWGGAESTVAVNVDPGMLAAMQRATLISPAWLAACTSTMGTRLNSMAVLAANNNTMQVSNYSPEAESPAVCNAMQVRRLSQRHHDQGQTQSASS